MKTDYINQFKRDLGFNTYGGSRFPDLKKGMSLETIQPNGKTVKENIKEYFDNKTPDEIVEDMGLTNTPIVEDVSMEDAVNNFVKKEYSAFEPYDDRMVTDIKVSKNDFKAGWQQREQQLLPIIKELGEKLNQFIEFHEKNASWDKTGQVYYNSKTTLDKYKNYL